MNKNIEFRIRNVSDTFMETIDRIHNQSNEATKSKAVKRALLDYLIIKRNLSIMRSQFESLEEKLFQAEETIRNYNSALKILRAY